MPACGVRPEAMANAMASGSATKADGYPSNKVEQELVEVVSYAERARTSEANVDQKIKRHFFIMPMERNPGQKPAFRSIQEVHARTGPVPD